MSIIDMQKIGRGAFEQGGKVVAVPAGWGQNAGGFSRRWPGFEEMF